MAKAKKKTKKKATKKKAVGSKKPPAEKKRKRGGQPQHTADHDKLAKKIAACGHSDAKIAEVMGISERTFYNWLINHPRFASAVKKGRENFDPANIELSLRAQALPHDDVVELYETRGRGKKSKMTKVGRRVKKGVVNTAAAMKVLAVEKPEKYGEKVEHKGSLGIVFNVKKTYVDTGKNDAGN